MLKISDLLFDSKSDRYFAVKAGVVLYRDDNHLSLSGAEFVSEALVNRILRKKDNDRKISELIQ
ncbi:MAG: hypothetical protein IPK77_12895 [Cellvibrio sp.]|nr:hypothetical protein [Cellvibrio sp.]